MPQTSSVEAFQSVLTPLSSSSFAFSIQGCLQLDPFACCVPQRTSCGVPRALSIRSPGLWITFIYPPQALLKLHWPLAPQLDAVDDFGANPAHWAAKNGSHSRPSAPSLLTYCEPAKHLNSMRDLNLNTFCVPPMDLPINQPKAPRVSPSVDGKRG